MMIAHQNADLEGVDATHEQAPGMNQALVGLGANIGNPLNQLARAVSTLAATEAVALEAVSRVYRSAPMGPSDQPDFLNACVRLSTQLTPAQLLDTLQAIEHAQGRVRQRHWGERCIDLDLLLVDNLRVETEMLTLPHPGLEDRDFVLRPLIDLLGPDYTLPSGTALSQALRDTTDHRLQTLDIDLLKLAKDTSND
jgi:2-amino-4-hydroxy-6-hydroxymethyldihydropteridine diphosphokinase